MHTQIFIDTSQSYCPSLKCYVCITLHRDTILACFKKSADHHLHRIKASRIHLLYQIGKDLLAIDTQVCTCFVYYMLHALGHSAYIRQIQTYCITEKFGR